MKRGSNNERGASLIELMVALGVFAVGALGLLRLTYGSIEGTGTASKLTHATALAQSKLDALMMLPFDATSLLAGSYTETKNLGPGGTAYTTLGAATGDYGADDGWFERSWTIVDQDLNTAYVGNDFKVVTVTVRWYDAVAKRRREVALVGGRSLQ